MLLFFFFKKKVSHTYSGAVSLPSGTLPSVPSASLLLVARGGVGGRCLVLLVGGGCGGHRQAIRGRDRPGRHAGGGAGAEAAAAFRISELFEV